MTIRFSRIRHTYWFKGLSLTVAFSFMFELIRPNVALALTGGPSQPEVESFEPIGTTEMVDLFSGDFNYNLPLLNVPGPNGGYPINMAYHAGIGMEQEASWVGLGWNLNVGAMKRSMRGLPDDFNGDEIEREYNIKPNQTFAVNFDEHQVNVDEALGADFQLNRRFQTYYNNYRGVGFKFGLSLESTTKVANSVTDLDEHSITGGFDLSFDTQQGVGLTPSLSFGKNNLNKAGYWNLAASFNSRQGFDDLSLSWQKQALEINSQQYMNEDGSITMLTSAYMKADGSSVGANFSSSTHVPTISSNMRGINTRIGFDFGETNLINWDKRIPLDVEYSTQFVPADDQEFTIPAYGYLNSQHATSNLAMMDFNREKDVAVTRRTPSISIGVATHDFYYASGQGTGGGFRAFRSDVGQYSDPKRTSQSVTYNSAMEIGTGPTVATPTVFKIGFDQYAGYSRSYSGGWSGAAGLLNYLKFANAGTDKLYEPSYFKAMGEQTASKYDMRGINGISPVNFQLGNLVSQVEALQVFQPLVKRVVRSIPILSTLGVSHYDLFDVKRPERERRIKSFQYRTVSQKLLSEDFTHTNRVNHLYPLNQFPIVAGNAPGSPISYPAGAQAHHLGEIEVVNPDGTRYLYGLPVYNMVHKDVAFSLDPSQSNTPTSNNAINKYDFPREVEYHATVENSIFNYSGQEHFYTSTNMPPYAHSHMLTGVVSTDYVDMTGNGLSEDDLGYYTKFNYSRASSSTTPYKWRVPYKGANYNKNYYANSGDDKASYAYGEKEMLYMNSVETKTHIAVFYISVREDALGVVSENNFVDGSGNTAAARSYKLDKIELYSKNEPLVPLKTVHFEYTYELCGGVENNTGNDFVLPDGTRPNERFGKLTLKKVFFTYLDNDKGRLSPYQFDYDDGDPITTENPPYSLIQMDRWGSYRPDDSGQSETLINNENPYVNQEQDYNRDGTLSPFDLLYRHSDASAWCLRKIILPSGGEIKVDYEADDYGYVQDLQAMQMMKIVGTSNLDEAIHNDDGNIKGDHRKIYFQLERPGLNDQDVFEYIKDIDDLYFKAWINLKKEVPSATGVAPEAFDYVEGYCQVVQTPTVDNFASYGIDHNHPDVGYFTVEMAGYNAGLSEAHPFRKAGWQYLRYSRPDLFSNSDEIFTNPDTRAIPNVPQLALLLVEAVTSLTGYYNKAKLRGWADKIQIGTSFYNPNAKPSFVRLNVASGKKYGGGHRVAKITLNDNWIESDHRYGQTYEYLTDDGFSSGVAEYEPLIGGEENPHRQPIWYNGSDQRISFRNKDVYLEKPYGESYYPGASVGYSRVVVRDLADDAGEVVKAQHGVSVTEFHTAKDFPVRVKVGALTTAPFNPPPIAIPLVGSYSLKSNGYSQGFTIVLNDMHGKPKAMTTYPAATDFTGDATAKVQYNYFVENDGRLRNKVPVLYDDGVYSSSILGQTHDFFTCERESNSLFVGVGLQSNVTIDVTVPVAPVIVPTFFPKFDLSYSLFRSVGTTKVIYQTGILRETVNLADGAVIKTENLMFDAETGQALLNKVTNEWRDPIYAYNYKADWAYDRMGGAYHNWGAIYFMQVGSSGQHGWQELLDANSVPVTDIAKFLNLGDELVTLNGTRYYVNAIDQQLNEAHLLTRDNTSPNANVGTVKVDRSGRRNQQSTMNGSIVTLGQSPLDYFPFNLYVTAHNANVPAGTFQFGFSDPNYLGSPWNATVSMSSGGSSSTIAINFNNSALPADSGEDCRRHLVHLPDGVFLSSLQDYIFIEFDALAGTAEMQSIAFPGTTYQCSFDPVPYTCFDDLKLQVLHASAIEFSDNDWQYNYTDVGSPIAENGVALDGTSFNPWLYGQRGIWRTKRTNAYQVDREQRGAGPDFKTVIGEDGEFASFTPFDWTPNGTNTLWDWVTEMTKYSPFGFGLEERNRLHVYSAQMYGYNNSVVTATAANSPYMEMAFDGFEDYDGATYASHGHLDFDPVGPLSDVESHTGFMSLRVAGQGNNYESTALDFIKEDNVYKDGTGAVVSPPDYMVFNAGEKYTVSGWFKSTTGDDPRLTAKVNGANVDVALGSASTLPAIEGWYKLEVNFVAPAADGTVLINLAFGNGVGLGYVDDLRIHRYKSAMNTYVYHPSRLWLIAQLDNRNFATFYNYDEEGQLVQVRKETERGIVTLSTTRNNTLQLQTP
jgi:hypothetical protein